MKELVKLERFKQQMVIEMQHNNHKGSILDWTDFNHILAELSYHEAKMLVAIRIKNYQAMKEYIADTANILFALGNLFGVYDEDSINNGFTYEMDRKVCLYKNIPVEESTRNSILHESLNKVTL